MMKRGFPVAILTLFCIHANAQSAPDFSALPDGATERQELVAKLLADSLDGFAATRTEPISEEERARNVEEIRKVFKPIIATSNDPEAVNRQLQNTIRNIRNQEVFHVHDDLELFGWCRVSLDGNAARGGLVYDTSVYSCSLDSPDRDQSTAMTEGVVQDIKAIIGARPGWTMLDNESRRENARKSIPQRQQVLTNARKTAANEATVQIFKGLLEQAEKDMNTDHFEMQQFAYRWTDENSPVQPGLKTKAPNSLSVMISNTFYKPEEEQAKVDQHSVGISIVVVKPRPAD